MEPYEQVVNACQLQSNILEVLLPNLGTQQSRQPLPLMQFAGAPEFGGAQRGSAASPLPKKTAGYNRKENGTEYHRPSFPPRNNTETNGTLFSPRGRGRGRGRKNYSKRGNQVNSNAFRDEPKPEPKSEPKPEPKSEPKSEPKIKERKEKDQDFKPVRPTEKKPEETKTSQKETKVKPATPSGGAKHDVKTDIPDQVTVPADDKSEEEIFKKPDLANLTIAAQLMPHLLSDGNGKSTRPLPNIAHVVTDIMPSLTIGSPVAGGNLKGKKKTIEDSMPCPGSPGPSSTSTMSSVDMSAKLREVSDTPKDSSILKPNGASVESLERYESASIVKGCDKSSKAMRPYAGKQEELKSSDPQFLPISLAMGQEYLFVTSQTTNQVQVFRDRKQEGVLKFNDSKYFSSVRNVHTILRSKEISQVVVLDNGGFHFFLENGLSIRTVLPGEGFKYRGLSHIHYDGKLCLVSLDVNAGEASGNGGTEVVIIDVDSKSRTDASIIKRLKITGTDNIPDMQSKCRFLTVTPDEKKVYVTSMLLNKIFSVDLLNGECKTFNQEIKAPAGIAIDPNAGTVFVSSREAGNVEIFNSDLGYLGKFLAVDAKLVGLCVNKENLYMATNASTMVNNAIIKAPIKYK